MVSPSSPSTLALSSWLTRIAAAVAISTIVAAAGDAQQAPAATARALVLTHANVIDGTSATPIRNATVIVSGGKIARIETGPVTTPGGADVIDLQGRYLLPGMIDAHTHMNNLAAARRALESGVITVRSASVGVALNRLPFGKEERAAAERTPSTPPTY